MNLALSTIDRDFLRINSALASTAHLYFYFYIAHKLKHIKQSKQLLQNKVVVCCTIYFLIFKKQKTFNIEVSSILNSESILNEFSTFCRGLKSVTSLAKLARTSRT